MRPIQRIAPEELDEHPFDEIIDVRAPSEFAEDHLPGAVNLPVLDDEQRERVGTIYVQQSPFEARRLGAGLVSANIARHLETHFAEKPKDYRPVVHCWRGGERSGAMAIVLDSVGWRPSVLNGGYKAYRKHVIDAFGKLVAARPALRIIAGLTGSGKTWLLDRLEAAGVQVIDLEGLAEHRGSALGESLSRPQPSQKAFESLLYEKLKSHDLSKPIYVESESSRIGRLQVPASFWSLMRESPVIEVEVPIAARARYLLGDYQHFVDNTALLAEKLDKVRHLQSAERFAEWEAQVAEGRWEAFVESLLEHHYDPAYLRSRVKTYGAVGHHLQAAEVTEQELDRLVTEIIAIGAE